jgi:hypothetical protein
MGMGNRNKELLMGWIRWLDIGHTWTTVGEAVSRALAAQHDSIFRLP